MVFLCLSENVFLKWENIVVIMIRVFYTRSNLSEMSDNMELMLIVLNKVDLLNELLTAFMDNELSGATVLDSSGMGHIISSQFPMFSMFAELEEEQAENSKTILKVVKTLEEREKAISIVESITGDLAGPDSAIIISLPVSYTKGINY